MYQFLSVSSFFSYNYVLWILNCLEVKLDLISHHFIQFSVLSVFIVLGLRAFVACSQTKVYFELKLDKV